MTKEQMQQAIILADKRGQRAKLKRLISYIIIATICSFIFLHKFFPKGFGEDMLGAVILGLILGFAIPCITAAYKAYAGIQVNYPEDQALKSLLRVYKEKFGEDFYGPWSH